MQLNCKIKIYTNHIIVTVPPSTKTEILALCTQPFWQMMVWDWCRTFWTIKSNIGISDMIILLIIGTFASLDNWLMMCSRCGNCLTYSVSTARYSLINNWMLDKLECTGQRLDFEGENLFKFNSAEIYCWSLLLFLTVTHFPPPSLNVTATVQVSIFRYCAFCICDRIGWFKAGGISLRYFSQNNYITV